MIAPVFGLDLLAPALNPLDRVWVPVMRTRRGRLTFESSMAATTYRDRMLTTNQQLRVRVIELAPENTEIAAP